MEITSQETGVRGRDGTIPGDPSIVPRMGRIGKFGARGTEAGLLPAVDPATEPHWYCVRTRPKSEHVARASLAQVEEVEAYCPRIRFQRSTARGKVWFTEALFPGYLFARFVAEQHLRAVSYANAVTSLLKFGGQYATLPPEIIEQIRREMEGEEIRQVSLPPPSVGSEVEVASGPFRGMEGIVTHLLHGGERVRILIEMFGDLQEVEMGRDRLARDSHPGLGIRPNRKEPSLLN